MLALLYFEDLKFLGKVFERSGIERTGQRRTWYLYVVVVLVLRTLDS